MSQQRQALAGVKIGHWTDHTARTGCTVVVFERPCLAAVDVRGGGPATRETDLLAPGRLVQRVDAIVLTGGSAFGLAAADGVVSELAALGRGFPTGVRPVPIVPAAALFDLAVGQAVAPDAAAGSAAFRNVAPIREVERGAVGAGAGATTSKLPVFGGEQPGGIGLGTVEWTGGAITALVAVNAVGAIGNPRQTPTDPLPNTPQKSQDARWAVLEEKTGSGTPLAGTATSLGVVVVDGPCRHDDLLRCAVSAHDGLARAIAPAHTPFDGDLFFVVALSEGDAAPPDVLKLSVGTELAVEAAIADAVTATRR
jgi:L-aminopeptidase/D-esterase-like protein